MKILLLKLAVLLAKCTFSMMCFGVAAYAFAFLYRYHSPQNPFAAQFAISGWDIPAHFFGAGTALLLAPLQMSSSIRERWPALHRTCGLIYAMAVLIGGVSGLSLAPKSFAGLPSALGFSILAVLWVGVTAKGIQLALLKRRDAHRVWMSYSIALTASAITLRLILFFGLAVLHAPIVPTYIVAAWGCWLVNLGGCAIFLSARRFAGDTRLGSGPRSV